ncbi:MAG TPA: SDR family NAD(P)-dependent oxidoreductase [Aliidongia sp.]|nr:SDR family NAD(P)-dependent oxidoreductase [Aliidongia sp.]
MPSHPALSAGRVAVITGAASGIGLAAAHKLAALGMKLCLADVNEEALHKATDSLPKGAEVLAIKTDVSRSDEVKHLKTAAYDRFGDVAFLLSNAGIEGGGKLFGSPERWQQILGVNLWGAIHCIQHFAPAMMGQRAPGAIVTTGSKQGITCPPGDTAYNVSKAGLKALTEALAHALRNEDCQVSAHLLIPGFTYTGLTRARGVDEKPAAAWTSEQVVDFMIEGMAAGDFYILCPDNDVPRATDEKRIAWAAGDIIENRPALSRWHPDFKDAFDKYMKS